MKKITEKIEPSMPLFDKCFDSLIMPIFPVLIRLKNKRWILLAIFLLSYYVWNAIQFHYGNTHYSIGESLSLAYVGLIIKTSMLLLWMLIIFSVLWLLRGLLETKLIIRAEKEQIDMIKEDVSISETAAELPKKAEDKYTSIKGQTPTIAILHHHKRSETHGKALSVTVSDEFKEVFLPTFCVTNINNNINSYEILKEQLESQSWTISDLGRIALLIYESNILQGKYRSNGFKKWFKDLCFFLGREDCPDEPDKSSYREFWKSNCSLCVVFSNLKTWYDKSGSGYIRFYDSDKVDVGHNRMR